MDNSEAHVTNPLLEVCDILTFVVTFPDQNTAIQVVLNKYFDLENPSHSYGTSKFYSLITESLEFINSFAPKDARAYAYSPIESFFNQLIQNKQNQAVHLYNQLFSQMKDHFCGLGSMMTSVVSSPKRIILNNDIKQEGINLINELIEEIKISKLPNSYRYRITMLLRHLEIDLVRSKYTNIDCLQSDFDQLAMFLFKMNNNAETSSDSTVSSISKKIVRLIATFTIVTGGFNDYMQLPESIGKVSAEYQALLRENPEKYQVMQEEKTTHALPFRSELPEE